MSWGLRCSSAAIRAKGDVIAAGPATSRGHLAAADVLPRCCLQAGQAAPCLQAAGVREEACSAWSRRWQASRSPAAHRRRSRPPCWRRTRPPCRCRFSPPCWGTQGNNGSSDGSSSGGTGASSRRCRGALLHRSDTLGLVKPATAVAFLGAGCWVPLAHTVCFDPPAAVLYCKYQPTKKLRKNKSFADGVLEVAVASKKAVGAGPPGCRYLLLLCTHHACLVG